MTKSRQADILALSTLIVLGLLVFSSLASSVNSMASLSSDYSANTRINRCHDAVVSRKVRELIYSNPTGTLDLHTLKSKTLYAAYGWSDANHLLNAARVRFLGDALFIYPSGEGALNRNGKKPEGLINFTSVGQVIDSQPDAGMLSDGQFTGGKEVQTIVSKVRSLPCIPGLSDLCPVHLPYRTLPLRRPATQFRMELVPEVWPVERLSQVGIGWN